MAAISMAVDPFLVKQKDGEKINFVSCIQVYGGTFQLFNLRKAQERGIEVRWVLHPEDINDWKAKIDENTRFVYMEAPSNPQQSFCDLKAFADLAHHWGIPFIIDATCATPALMRPIDFGADIVVHSLTKSITAGGMAIGGALISRKPIVTKIKNDHPLFKDELRRIRQVPPLPRQRARRLARQRHVRPERPPDAPVAHGPRQRELPDGRRVAGKTSQGLPGGLPRTAERPAPCPGQEDT